MVRLLTKEDLQERWQLGSRTIDRYKEEGIIVPIKGLPCVRFNEQDIELIEGSLPNKVTRREKELEKELKAVTEERDILKIALSKILLETNKAISYQK